MEDKEDIKIDTFGWMVAHDFQMRWQRRDGHIVTKSTKNITEGHVSGF